MTGEQERLVCEHVDFARRLVGAFMRHRPRELAEDAIADGLLGLVKAAQRWRPDRGASFKTWATTWILGAAYDGLRRQALGPRKGPQLQVLSLEHPLGEGELTFLELLEAPEHDVDQELDVGRALARLPERERFVLVMRFFEDLRHHEVAELLGVSESRVSQIETRAKSRMRVAA